MARRSTTSAGDEEAPQEQPSLPVEPEPAPTIGIVNFEDQIELESKPPEIQQESVLFWFGHVGVLKFPDQTSYHIRDRQVRISDPVLIANLKESAKNPHNHIFIQ